MGRSAIVLAGMLVVASCSPYGSQSADPPADAAPNADAGAPDASADTSADGGADAPAACVGGRLRGVLFDATTAKTGQVCNIENALVADGVVAGLEAADFEGQTLVDGEGVYGCIGVEFDRTVQTLFVRIGAVANACGRACDGAGCGDGRSAAVFASASRSGYAFVAAPDVGSMISEHVVALPSGTRVVMVCRRAWSADKDDIALDSVEGDCP